MADSSRALQLNTDALRHASRQFFAWWGRELAGWLPAGLRHWWSGSNGLVLLFFETSQLRFSQPTSAGLSELFSIGLTEQGTSQPTAIIRERLAKAIGSPYALLLVAPDKHVLQRQVSLPTVLAENLRQTLGFELDRYTPFAADSAYFDFVVSDHATEANGLLQVDLAVVPKTSVDPIVSRLTSLGLLLDGLVLAEDFGNSRSGHNVANTGQKNGLKSAGLDAAENSAQAGRYRNLLPNANTKREPSQRYKLRRWLFLLATLLLLAALIVPIWQKRATAVSLLLPVAKARAAAQETDALRDKLTKLVEIHDLLPNKKWDSYLATRVLDELTRLLPDDTYVMQLDFDGKSVQIIGETGSAGKLVEVLEASPWFKDVSFKSPLTKIQGSAIDRFQIGANLEGSNRAQQPGMPNPVVETSVATPMPPVTPKAGP